MTPAQTFWRYLRIQAFVLLCGIVGPIFLVVYFALGADPMFKWMFWAGLAITAADVLIALGITSFGIRSAAKLAALEQDGVLALARITRLEHTSTQINNRPLVKLDLQISGPGIGTFTGRDRVIASLDRLPAITGRRLVTLVDPTTQEYRIDWQRSAFVNGSTPFILTDGDESHDLSGQVEPVLEILQILKNHGIAADGAIDLRAHPGARHQVQAVLRRAAAQTAPTATAATPSPSTAQRLLELEVLHTSGVITEAEYQSKRQQIIAEL